MASGVNENWKSDEMQMTTSANDTKPDELEMNNTLLLLIIIALCALIVLLLLFVFLCICFKSSKSTNNQHINDVRIVFLSKATSVTGLCENANNIVEKDKLLSATNNCNVNGKLIATMDQSLLESNQTKLITSTPAGKLDNEEMSSHVPTKESGNIAVSIESKHVNGRSDDTSNEHHCLLPLSHTDTSTESSPNWASMTLTPTTDSSLYATANSLKLDGLCTSENLAQYLIDDLKGQSEKEPDIISPDSEFSPLNSAKISKSMPLHAYGHPRAWFVPLDKVNHEPIRHSYIEMPKQHSAIFDNKSGEDDISQPKNSGLRLYLPSTTNSKENGCVEFTEQGSECDMRWRDSGIPQSSLVRYNSTDFDKKPSVWEQREDRPVVFLENPDSASISPRSNERT